MRLWLVLWLVASSGCSLTYGEDYFSARELRGLEVAPIEILEGQADVPILVVGKGIAADAEITVTLAEPDRVHEDGR